MNGIFTTYIISTRLCLPHDSTGHFVEQCRKQLSAGYHLQQSSLNLLLIVRLLVEFCQTEHRLYLREREYGLDCFQELMASRNPSCD